MDIKRIESLIKQGESSCLEFKSSTSQLKPAFETVCALLNGKGGIVLIGVKNNGQIIGQDVTDNTRQEIAREIKKLEPPTSVEVHYVPVGYKFIIVIKVNAGQHAPYVYDARPYQRLESATTLMSQHLYEQLLVKRGQLNHVWEKQFAEGYDIDDLDHEEIRRTIKEGIDQNRIGVEVMNYDIQHILNNLHLLKDGKLTNAAVVLYAKEMSSTYSNCMIRLARFRGNDKLGDFIDNQRVSGNAFHLISAGIEFAQRHLPIASFFEPNNMRRIDQPAIPVLALREALLNAVSHRDYANHSASLSLAIYDDRLELWNNGELMPPLKIEDLKKPHESHSRNEEIATIFYKRGWVEGWGTGTLRMAGYCKKNGTPEPEFMEFSGGFMVIFRFKEPMNSVLQESTKETLTDDLSSRQKEILKILSNKGKMPIGDILDHLTDAPAPRTLREDLADLKVKGLIELEGRAKTAKWKLSKK